MALRDDILIDLAAIFADTSGPKHAVTLTAPDGTSEALNALTGDIGQIVDLETGAVISGRSISVSIPISAIYGAGFASLPVGISDAAGKPWRVSMIDHWGNTHTLRVQSSAPDRSIGIVTMSLEVYQ